MNIAVLEDIQNRVLAENNLSVNRNNARVVVGLATCGIAAGAMPVFEKLKEEVNKRDLNITVSRTGCIGVCRLEPIVEVFRPGEPRITYVNVKPEHIERIVEEHLIQGKPVEELTIAKAENMPFDEVKSLEDVDFFKAQKRVVLKNCGYIDPENIDEYIAMDGYKALYDVLTNMKPLDVIDIITKSGLRGRGGAGFPTGLKWKLTLGDAPVKYVICNADEGDPGAFMDRSVLEGDPHAVLEAMTIAGYAVGATHGYIYVRAEYPVAIKRLDIAIKQAREKGFLGNNIFGSGFNFDIELRLGAGAFVCGEETALISSIEGRRGEPRPKPPFPSVKGAFSKPSFINNVETFANVPAIIRNGAEWFTSMGTEKSPGTKVFALGGKINNPGLVEVEIGTTLRDILYRIGGGIPKGKKFKAAQTGGPSGGCIPADKIDIPIDYETLTELGSMMGSGGMIVMDEDNCMVDIARFFLDFTVDESCGKCSPCRIGTKRMLEMLERIVCGEGKQGDIDMLEKLGDNIKSTSLCGLGQSAPNPVLSTLRHFRSEYDAHIQQKCPSHHCKALIEYFIVPELCRGCNLCAKSCPQDAISGVIKSPYKIDPEKCIKCGVCIAKCRFGAIVIN